MTGMDIVWWLVERKQKGKYVPPNIVVHSANCVGAPIMEETIDRFLKD